MEDTVNDSQVGGAHEEPPAGEDADIDAETTASVFPRIAFEQHTYRSQQRMSAGADATEAVEAAAAAEAAEKAEQAAKEAEEARKRELELEKQKQEEY